jgi:hypothetical protein
MIELWGAQGKEKGDRFRANKDLLATSIQEIAKLEKALVPFTDLERQIQAQTRAMDQAQSRLDFLQSISAQWNKERAPRLKEINALIKSENFAKSARERLAQIDSELKAIGYDAAKHDALRASEKEKRAIETELRQLEQANAALKPLQREIGELETQVTQQGRSRQSPHQSSNRACRRGGRPTRCTWHGIATARSAGKRKHDAPGGRCRQTARCGAGRFTPAQS